MLQTQVLVPGPSIRHEELPVQPPLFVRHLFTAVQLRPLFVGDVKFVAHVQLFKPGPVYEHVELFPLSPG